VSPLPPQACLPLLAIALGCALAAALPLLAAETPRSTKAAAKAAARTKPAAATTRVTTNPAAAPTVRWKPRDDEAEAFFARHVIPTLKLEINEEELKALQQNTRLYARATVREAIPSAPERAYADVGVRLKGSAGSYRGINSKPGLTLSFGRFSLKQRYHGLGRVHLNNAVQDPSYLCENLGGWVFRRAGIPAARVTNARVFLNGRDLGLYCVVESVDGNFLRRWFGENAGTVYEGDHDIDTPLPTKLRGEDDPEFARALDPKRRPRPATRAGEPPVADESADPDDARRAVAEEERKVAEAQRKLDESRRKALDRLKELAEAARDGDPHDRRARVGQLLDPDRFLTVAAAEALLVHWDGYSPNRNNYRLYHDVAAGRFVFLPHGMDQLLQGERFGLLHTTGLVARALLDDPNDRAHYYARMAELRRTAFEPEALAKYLDEVAARIQPVLNEMDAEAGQRFERDAAGLRKRLFERAAFVDRRLAQVLTPLPFDADGVARPGAWSLTVSEGEATVERAPDVPGALRLRAGATGCTASLRTTVLLAPGRYTFEGRCRASEVVALDSGGGVSLRISGQHVDGGLVGETDWQAGTFDFELPGPGEAEVTLVCELRARGGDAAFDEASLRLRRR